MKSCSEVGLTLVNIELLTGGILILLIGGLGIFLTVRRSNDAAPNPNHAAEWRSCPSWLHGFLRDDGGPVLVTAVAVEFAALVMLVAGLLAFAGVLKAGWLGTAAYYSIAV